MDLDPHLGTSFMVNAFDLLNFNLQRPIHVHGQSFGIVIQDPQPLADFLVNGFHQIGIGVDRETAKIKCTFPLGDQIAGAGIGHFQANGPRPAEVGTADR